MDKKKQPGINFDNIFLKEMKFKRKPKNIGSDINLDFASNISVSDNEEKLYYELICKVSDDKKVFSLECSMMGVFSAVEGKENMSIKHFAEHNAPALMLPYIRELVTTTTIRAGLRPISFPPINIIALLKEQKENSLI